MVCKILLLLAQFEWNSATNKTKIRGGGIVFHIHLYITDLKRTFTSYCMTLYYFFPPIWNGSGIIGVLKSYILYNVTVECVSVMQLYMWDVVH